MVVLLLHEVWKRNTDCRVNEQVSHFGPDVAVDLLALGACYSPEALKFGLAWCDGSSLCFCHSLRGIFDTLRAAGLICS